MGRINKISAKGVKKNMPADQEEFLLRLQEEASFQALLEQQKVLPEKLTPFLSFIAQYPLRFLLGVSFVTAIGFFCFFKV